MEELDYQLLGTQLAANISNDGQITYCENLIFGIAEDSYTRDGALIGEQFMDAHGEITFFGLNPKRNFSEDCFHLGYTGELPSFECYVNESDCIVVIQWQKIGIKAGYLSPAPSYTDQPPVAGLLALAKVQEQIQDPKAYKKAEDALFKAIGKAIYPNEAKSTKFTRRQYREYLNKHHICGSSPIKGAPVQLGHRCMINGELCVFTPYGVLQVTRGCYGDLVCDCAISVKLSDGQSSLGLRISCNSEFPTDLEFSGTYTLADEQGAISLSYFPEVMEILLTHYKDEQKAKSIYTALLSILCFPDSSVSLQQRWVNATEIFEAVYPDNEIPPRLTTPYDTLLRIELSS